VYFFPYNQNRVIIHPQQRCTEKYYTKTFVHRPVNMPSKLLYERCESRGEEEREANRSREKAYK